MSPVSTIVYVVSRCLNPLLSWYLTLFYGYNPPDVLGKSVTIEVLSDCQTLVTEAVIEYVKNYYILNDKN